MNEFEGLDADSSVVEPLRVEDDFAVEEGHSESIAVGAYIEPDVFTGKTVAIRVAMGGLGFVGRNGLGTKRGRHRRHFCSLEEVCAIVMLYG
jgi:hypothetical protein